jgi:hypothetical protein
MRRPPFAFVVFSRLALAAQALTLTRCRSTEPRAHRDNVPVPTASAHLESPQSDSAKASAVADGATEWGVPSASAPSQGGLAVGSIHDGVCPEPPEVDPHDCTWHPWLAVPEEQERTAAWPHSDAARLWSGWCRPRPSSSTTVGQRLWIPPKLKPHSDEGGSTSQFLENCSWWSPSPEPRPPGLMFVVLEAAMFDYGINIFEDGRVVFQSLRCQRDQTVRVRKISTADVAILVTTFKAAKFVERKECVQLSSDMDLTALGFYPDERGKVVRANRESSDDAPVVRLADLVERAAAAGSWVR